MHSLLFFRHTCRNQPNTITMNSLEDLYYYLHDFTVHFLYFILMPPQIVGCVQERIRSDLLCQGATKIDYKQIAASIDSFFIIPTSIVEVYLQILTFLEFGILLVVIVSTTTTSTTTTTTTAFHYNTSARGSIHKRWLPSHSWFGFAGWGWP